MLGNRIAIGTGIATALAGVAIAVPAGGAQPLDHGRDAARPARTTMLAWQLGLKLRSEGLNRRYGLGLYALAPSSAVALPVWQNALLVRSDALNRKFGLGEYAKTG